ncbi:MAG: CBS domain-containing protein [Thermoflexales bacterium]|nr:CBS domain-containing protein [Thermoflexales bacterium]
MVNYQVLDWMTPNPITITPKTTLPEAHRLMKERKVRRLPVLENGKLVGIVTLGDIREAEPSAATTLSVWELNYLLDTLTVDKIMRRNIVSVTPRTSIREAASLMLAHKVSGMPVVDNDRLVGVITESDIFRMLVREMLPEPPKAG